MLPLAVTAGGDKAPACLRGERIICHISRDKVSRLSSLCHETPRIKS